VKPFFTHFNNFINQFKNLAIIKYFIIKLLGFELIYLFITKLITNLANHISWFFIIYDLNVTININLILILILIWIHYLLLNYLVILLKRNLIYLFYYLRIHSLNINILIYKTL